MQDLVIPVGDAARGIILFCEARFKLQVQMLLVVLGGR